MQQGQQQQQQEGQPQHSPNVITANPYNDIYFEKLGPSAVSQLNVLSIIQLVMGALCTIFGIVLLALDINQDYEGSELGILSYGIWIGIFILIAGGTGKSAATINTISSVRAAMIFNILVASLFCFPLFLFSAAGLAITTTNACNDRFFGFSWGFCGEKSITKTFHALDSLMLLIAIAEFVITIWAAVLCCGAVCRCCKRESPGHVVHYQGQPQQIVMYPSVPTVAYTGYPGPPAGATFHAGYPYGVHPTPQQPYGGYAVQTHAPPAYYPTPQQLPHLHHPPQSTAYQTDDKQRF